MGQEQTGCLRFWPKLVVLSDQLNGYKFEQTLGDGEGQGSLATTVHGVTKSRTRLSN